MKWYWSYLGNTHAFQWGKMHIHPCWEKKAARKKGKAIKDLHRLCGDIFYLISLLYLTCHQRPDEGKAHEGLYHATGEDWTPLCSERGAESPRSHSASGNLCTLPRRSSCRGWTHSCFLTPPPQGKPDLNQLCKMLLSPRKRLSPTSSFSAPHIPIALCLLPFSTTDWGMIYVKTNLWSTKTNGWF